MYVGNKIFILEAQRPLKIPVVIVFDPAWKFNN